MIRINLLPYRTERRQRQILQHISVTLGALGLVILLAVASHIANTMTLSSLKDEHADLMKQDQLLLKKIGKIKDLDKLRADVERKLKLVDTLQDGRFRSLEMLIALSKAIPENVWLTNIVDKGGSLQLAGLGESNKAVANFMRALDQSSLFSNVRLQVISRQQVNGTPVRQFNLLMDRVKVSSAKAGKGNS
jgi:type IV pilus assembly protein PilN